MLRNRSWLKRTLIAVLNITVYEIDTLGTIETRLYPRDVIPREIQHWRSSGIVDLKGMQDVIEKGLKKGNKRHDEWNAGNMPISKLTHTLPPVSCMQACGSWDEKTCRYETLCNYLVGKKRKFVTVNF